MTRDIRNMVARVRAGYYFDRFGAGVLGAVAVPGSARAGTSVVNSGIYAGVEYVKQPRTRVEIDLNVRVRGNDTFVGFEDVYGPLAVGEAVEVFESESGVSGDGRVTQIDGERELVYLSVDWASIREEGGSSHSDVSPTTVQTFYVGAGSSATATFHDPWIELVPQPCLATLDGANGAMWVTASLYNATDLLLGAFTEPYLDIRQVNTNPWVTMGVAA